MARALSETRCTSPGWSECLVSWLKRCLWTSWVTIPWRQNCCNLRWMWTWPSMRRCWTSFFFAGWGGQRWPIQPGDVVWTWVNLIFFGEHMANRTTSSSHGWVWIQVSWALGSGDSSDSLKLDMLFLGWSMLSGLHYMIWMIITDPRFWPTWKWNRSRRGSETPIVDLNKSKELQHIALVQESKMRMLTFPRLPYIATAKGTEK